MSSSGNTVRRRVLVVDDNREVADALALLVEVLGHEARNLYGGADVVGAVQEYHPDVIFLDLGMPDVDGFEVARDLGRLPQRGTITLVALTGYGDDTVGESVQAAGFDHHLLKPAEAEALRAILSA